MNQTAEREKWFNADDAVPPNTAERVKNVAAVAHPPGASGSFVNSYLHLQLCQPISSLAETPCGESHAKPGQTSRTLCGCIPNTQRVKEDCLFSGHYLLWAEVKGMVCVSNADLGRTLSNIGMCFVLASWPRKQFFF
jgi:hypothetical protein